MLIEKIKLWEDCETANLYSYILENSQEFKKDEKKPAVIICPGGAYLSTSDREAEPVAMKFMAQGYNAFVLRYNTYFTEPVKDWGELPDINTNSTYPAPLFDLAKSIKIIRENAEKWFIDSDKIIICGFSAGAHLCASLAVHWQEEFLKEKIGSDNEQLMPNAVILSYPLLDYNVMKEGIDAAQNYRINGLWEISNKAVFGKSEVSEEERSKLSPTNYVTSKTPPTFIWHTTEDNLVYVSNSLKFAAELTKNKVPYALHIFESGEHGLSLSDETTAANEQQINEECRDWFDLALKWLKKRV